eukprot:scaffold3248_cov112-Cylindrotheca_fusiformis.AAC.8
MMSRQFERGTPLLYKQEDKNGVPTWVDAVVTDVTTTKTMLWYGIRSTSSSPSSSLNLSGVSHEHLECMVLAKQYLDQCVAKDFGIALGGIYKGTVSDVNRGTSGGILFQVVYSDGDWEDMEKHELKDAIQFYRTYCAAETAAVVAAAARNNNATGSRDDEFLVLANQYKGRLIAKDFGIKLGGIFNGVVFDVIRGRSSDDDGNDMILFVVFFSDGDWEHLEEHEVKHGIELFQTVGSSLNGDVDGNGDVGNDNAGILRALLNRIDSIPENLPLIASAATRASSREASNDTCSNGTKENQHPNRLCT